MNFNDVSLIFGIKTQLTFDFISFLEEYVTSLPKYHVQSKICILECLEEACKCQKFLKQ